MAPPAGAKDTYFDHFAICPEWNDASDIIRCRVPVGYVAAVGVGQTVDCPESGGHLSPDPWNLQLNGDICTASVKMEKHLSCEYCSSNVFDLEQSACSNKGSDPVDGFTFGGTECHPCGLDDGREEIEVDYLIVGAGPAGLSTAADLSKVLQESESHSSVAVIEKNSRVGGRFLDVDLDTPGSSYAGPPLRGALGAARMNPSTFPNVRRQMNEYDIQLYCSIFNNRLNTRGRSASCNLQNECHIFGDFCSYEQVFVNETNTEEMPYGAAFVGLTDVLRDTGDPEGAAYSYILGYDEINTFTGIQCDNNKENPKEQCPDKACKSAVDWGSFLQEHLSNEYAELISAGNGKRLYHDSFTSNAKW